eukprot:5303863-Prymnesium_polylepis.1
MGSHLRRRGEREVCKVEDRRNDPVAHADADLTEPGHGDVLFGVGGQVRVVRDDQRHIKQPRIQLRAAAPVGG